MSRNYYCQYTLLFIGKCSCFAFRKTGVRNCVNSCNDLNKILDCVFVVASCMLIVLSPLFVQLMRKNYYKIVKQLKSFKIVIVAPTCFGLHKPSSGSSQPVLR